MCRGTRRSLASLLCLGLLISATIVAGDAAADAAAPVTVAAVMASSSSLPSSSSSSSSSWRGDREMGDKAFRDSKRRVPNGPDPIHNRRAGRFGRPPVRA